MNDIEDIFTAELFEKEILKYIKEAQELFYNRKVRLMKTTTPKNTNTKLKNEITEVEVMIKDYEKRINPEWDKIMIKELNQKIKEKKTAHGENLNKLLAEIELLVNRIVHHDRFRFFLLEAYKYLDKMERKGYDLYWKYGWQQQVAPGTRTIKEEVPSEHGPYHRELHYDEYGRAIGITDYTHHDLPEEHDLPHSHHLVTGSGSKIKNPKTGNIVWEGIFDPNALKKYLASNRNLKFK